MGGSVDFSCVRARYISGWPSFLPLICLGEIYPFGQGWRVFVSRVDDDGLRKESFPLTLSLSQSD